MKNIIITGANSGLGFETAKLLAKEPGSRIILACRNSQKAEDAKNSIVSETKNENIVAMKLDTSLLASVREFAQNYIDTFGTVDVLINNAGISPMAGHGCTAEGFETVFATNYLGHFLLTRLLLSHISTNGRIVSVTSDMHNPPGGIEWKGMGYLKQQAAEDRQKYSYSKLCLIHFTHRMAQILQEHNSGITINSFNPGFMAATNFAGGHMTEERALEVKKSMPERYGELETSAAALAEIATDSRFAKINGAYFDRSTTTAYSSELSYDAAIEEEIWGKSNEYCGISGKDTDPDLRHQTVGKNS